MYACLCRAVSERRVRDAVARGARCVEDLAASCGAGSNCGGCLPSLQKLLTEYGAQDPARPVSEAACVVASSAA